MNSKLKKGLIIGGISAVTITGAYLYWQFTKIKDYVIKFKKVSIKNLSMNNIDLNIYLFLQNKSNIKYIIKSQEYSIYINDVFVSKAVNYSPNVIEANSTNDIGFNIVINLSDAVSKLKGIGADFLLRPEKVRLKVDMNLKVSLWVFKLNIPYIYETTIKELLSKKDK